MLHQLSSIFARTHGRGWRIVRRADDESLRKCNVCFIKIPLHTKLNKGSFQAKCMKNFSSHYARESFRPQCPFAPSATSANDLQEIPLNRSRLHSSKTRNKHWLRCYSWRIQWFLGRIRSCTHQHQPHHASSTWSCQHGNTISAVKLSSRRYFTATLHTSGW